MVSTGAYSLILQTRLLLPLLLQTFHLVELPRKMRHLYRDALRQNTYVELGPMGAQIAHIYVIPMIKALCVHLGDESLERYCGRQTRPTCEIAFLVPVA